MNAVPAAFDSTVADRSAPMRRMGLAVARWNDAVRDDGMHPTGFSARSRLLALANFPEAQLWAAFLAGDHVELGRLWAEAIHNRIAEEADWETQESDNPDLYDDLGGKCAKPVSPTDYHTEAPRPLRQTTGD